MGTLIRFGDIENAYLYVSSNPYDSNSAFLSRETGQILYQSEMTDIDEVGDQDLDMKIWVAIPHKNDLGLGRELVFDFVAEYLPEDYERVYGMFQRRGAYRIYKDFLDSKGLLQKWYDYENRRQEEALRQWCEDNGIELSDCIIE